MRASLHLRQSQHLALTPQLQQSIRLLQLSALELNQEIEQGLADNPLLEREDDPQATPLRVAGDGGIVGSGAVAEPAAVPAPGGDADEAEATDRLTDWGGSGAGRDDEDDERGPQAWAAQATDLREHLVAQLALTRAAPRDRALVELLIGALDDNGYLETPLEDVLALCPAEAQIEQDDLTAALRLLQSLEPAGVGARCAAECLALQLHALARQPGAAAPAALALAQRIVAGHLPLLAARDFGKLKRLLGADDDDLRAAHALIRSLDPHPGAAFAAGTADYVVPDVLVRRVRSRWVAQVNPEVMPRLRINADYAAAVKRASRGTDGQGSWSARLQEARWLIRNLQQRFDTIERVAQAIVDRQAQFFNHGAIAMRPLVLREIADTVGLHESTISRVTTQKFMATPFGIYELKYFFGSHVATDSGGAASSTAIRALIRQLIGAEDPRVPLSDSRIAELLGAQGIVVARRTVAKYRESLKIAPVALRRTL
ncbi:MAG: RNA polymerase factor sigma-54 [Betaproteobacteria bacterium]